MKKYTLTLIITAIILNSQLTAANSITDSFIAFKKWAEYKKVAWLKWHGKLETEKYSLLAKQAKEWFEYGINNIKLLDQLKNSTEKEALLKKELIQAISLHEKHALEHRSFWDKKVEEARTMANANEAELQKFKNDHGL